MALLVRLRNELRKNDPKWRRKKCSFTKTMHRVTSRLQQWQNCTNFTLNCFPIHRIFRIWLPATTPNLQTKKMLQGKRFGSNEEMIAETETFTRICEHLFYISCSYYSKDNVSFQRSINWKKRWFIYKEIIFYSDLFHYTKIIIDGRDKFDYFF